jgi:hypothetical protein
MEIVEVMSFEEKGIFNPDMRKPEEYFGPSLLGSRWATPIARGVGRPFNGSYEKEKTKGLTKRAPIADYKLPFA